MTAFFLLSGLFLGWSLGANDASNIFGTAVGTRMVKFTVAATILTAGIIAGAVISGAGATETLGKLGAVNAMAGSFTVCLAAAAVVAWMTKLALPISTSQAIVGAIVGWNLFTGAPTDPSTLAVIVSTWVFSPALAALLAWTLFHLFKRFMDQTTVHILRQDSYVRIMLILAGAFGAYSLGANNIANVVGVFVPARIFPDIQLAGVTLTGAQQLFFLGALAVGLGVFTYAKKVMLTVGNDIFELNGVTAFICVLAESIVLFLFASADLERFLLTHGLPAFPLVPVSSSQAIVGAVIGIGIAKGRGAGINFRIVGKIFTGWIATPLAAGIACFVGLFIVQNVFDQTVVKPVAYEINAQVLDKMARENMDTTLLKTLAGRSYDSSSAFRQDLTGIGDWGESDLSRIYLYARKETLRANADLPDPRLQDETFTPEEMAAIRRLHGRTFDYPWQLNEALADQSNAWKKRLDDRGVGKIHNQDLKKKQVLLYHIFRVCQGL